MGNTILQSLARNFQGLLLQESFESPDFASDQGWTLLNGTPTITTAVSYEGLRSLQMDDSYPQIEKATNGFAWSACYFFDDSTQTTSTFKPFVSWLNAGGTVEYALGVDNSVSTGFYTKIVAGVVSASTIARTDGWHRFEFKYLNSGGGFVQLKVDGVLADNTAGTFLPRLLRVGAWVYTGTPAFGYFDDAQICTGPDVIFTRMATITGLISLYDSDDNLVASGTLANGFIRLDVSAVNQPFDGYIKVTRPDGIRPYYQGSVISMAGGDAYTLNVFDLGRRLSSFTKPRQRMSDNKESSSGKDQTLFYYSRDQVSFTFTDLTEDQVQEMQRWWGTVINGAQFSAAIDSDDTWVSKSTANITAGSSGIPVTSTVGLNKNSQVMLSRGNGQATEVAKILSIVSSSFAFTVLAVLNEYFPGDIFRSVYYWPYCVVTDASFNPTLINPRLKRWNVTISFKEAL